MDGGGAPLGQDEVELCGGALEGALERVEDLHVDLGPVEGAVTLVGKVARE